MTAPAGHVKVILHLLIATVWSCNFLDPLPVACKVCDEGLKITWFPNRFPDFYWDFRVPKLISSSICRRLLWFRFSSQDFFWFLALVLQCQFYYNKKEGRRKGLSEKVSSVWHSVADNILGTEEVTLGWNSWNRRHLEVTTSRFQGGACVKGATCAGGGGGSACRAPWGTPCMSAQCQALVPPLTMFNCVKLHCSHVHQH